MISFKYVNLAKKIHVGLMIFLMNLKIYLLQSHY